MYFRPRQPQGGERRDYFRDLINPDGFPRTNQTARVSLHIANPYDTEDE